MEVFVDSIITNLPIGTKQGKKQNIKSKYLDDLTLRGAFKKSCFIMCQKKPKL